MSREINGQTDSPRVNVVRGLCAYNIKLHKKIRRSNKLKIDVQKKNMKSENLKAENTNSCQSSTVLLLDLKYPDAVLT